ncbi:AAA ATPase central domain protein [Gloeothece citriformis PCC 7424]|uniref:AAA ATPase central domain protein n=1 Tax=Gloeothece citriformis (strain PCC 7424) TaxID=65393 RepID=B7KB59_GLOC7|nr:ATP-binding protein [Gloeothece citriformis]ACK70169.1 AAA ATPase central domain protein [Gloeothece citriformis PCC 7424]
MTNTTTDEQLTVNSGYYLNNALNWLKLKLNFYISQYESSVDAFSPADSLKEKAVNLSPLPAFITLSQTLQLSEFEQNILLLCVAIEINPHFAQLYAQAHKNEKINYPTFALAFSLFDQFNWEAIAPNSPLRYWGLIEILSLKNESLINCPIQLKERILHYFLGINQIDVRLLSYLIPLSSSDDNILSPSQQQIKEKILNNWQNQDYSPKLPHFYLFGANSSIKKIICQVLCQEKGLTLYQLIVEQIPTNSQELTNFIRLWQRESQLLPLALYIDIQSLEGKNPNAQHTTALRQFFQSCQGIFFIDSYDNDLGLSSHKMTVEVNKPTPEEQYHYWCQLLGENNELVAKQLTSQFNLNLTDIEEIFRSPQPPLEEIKNRSPQPPFLRGANSVNLAENDLFKQLWQSCLTYTTPKIDKLAQRIELKATWEDIVLPEAIKGQLEHIVAQIRYRHQVYDEWGYRKRLNRGLGVSAVFAGESGTGKTMAAEVIANELQLNLYRIDLSTVVSKYIGETEKNLRRLFDAAEEGGGILFFDEADALFGKRSEVKDSHDRYANIETNYLLQRLESYSGLAILATNKRASMDIAFMRRLRYIIDFPFPSPEIRQQIWRKVFPPQVPLDELDYDYLAQISLTGGSIINIALNASFMAASKGGKIGMNEIMSAIRAEFLKTERPLYELNIKPKTEIWSYWDEEEEVFEEI